jgi:hypothetical protein
MTSKISEGITDFVFIELEFIDDVGDKALGGGQRVIAFPVSADEDFSHLCD